MVRLARNVAADVRRFHMNAHLLAAILAGWQNNMEPPHVGWYT